MEALDLERPELASVRRAWHAGDGDAALHALIRHFETRRLDHRLLWEPAVGAAEHRRRADAALAGRFELQDASARPPRRPDGGLDWRYSGPSRDPEWPRFLNRHDFFRSLLRAWHDTGEDRYRRCINELLLDWLDQVPAPRGRSLDPAWRSLEAARRATLAWLEVFFAHAPGPALDPLPRLRMLLGILDHGRLLRRRHARFGNHLFTEVVALAVLATAWPELRAARSWRDYGLDRAVRTLLRQTYPDGAHSELSNHYHRVVVMEAERLLAVLRHCLGEPRADRGLQGATRHGERHAVVEERVRAMWSYFAGLTLPDGTGPLNNDGDREPNARYLREASRRHGDSEWLHVASGGREGETPPSPPSRFYPWAAQAVMRSGWDRDAQWARFDMGPHGTAHQHADQLSLEVSVGERHLLVDPGRYTYRPGPARDYMKGPSGHNVLRIGGRGSIEPPWRAREPSRGCALRTPALDFFRHRAHFPADVWRGHRGARWTRAVIYLRGECWVVLDRLEVGGPSDVAASWLFHPQCRVEVGEDGVLTCDPGVPNLALVPAGAVDWRVNSCRGVRTPEWRGWYSDRYNVIAACTQVEFRACAHVPFLAGWLLYPLAADAPRRVPALRLEAVRPEAVRVTIDREDGAVEMMAALDGASLTGLVPGGQGQAPCVLTRDG